MTTTDDTILTSLPQTRESSLDVLRELAVGLAQQFTVALEDCARLIRTEPVEQTTPAMLTSISKGVANFGRFDAAITEKTVPERAHEPLRQLARAYLSGFEAVGAVALLSQQTTLPVEAPQLVELAAKSARALQQLTDLVFGNRHLGSVDSTFAYVGSLENQADSLFRAGVRQLAKASSGDVTQPGDVATRYRSLVSLELLTDRCEEIAESLLLVYWLE